MAISDGQLERIEKLLLADTSCSNVAALRLAFPGLVVTRCDAGDMQDETPFRRFSQFDVYLLDTRDHCVRLTADPAHATGVVLAQRP
ncbi:MAG: hypothetical protein AABY83_13425 [Pseudomonadota bacterium]